MAGKNPSHEKRPAERKTLSKRIPRHGRVVFSDDADAVHCSVREYSPQGAIITMTGWLAMPSSFKLYVEPDCIRAECRVLSRKGNNIRVEFTDIEENIRFRSNQFAVQQTSMIA